MRAVQNAEFAKNWCSENQEWGVDLRDNLYGSTLLSRAGVDATLTLQLVVVVLPPKRSAIDALSSNFGFFEGFPHA